MSSFSEGFSQGSAIYNNAERNKLLEAANQREQELHDFVKDDRKKVSNQQDILSQAFNPNPTENVANTDTEAYKQAIPLPDGQMGAPTPQMTVVPIDKTKYQNDTLQRYIAQGGDPTRYFGALKGQRDNTLDSKMHDLMVGRAKDNEALEEAYSNGDIAGLVKIGGPIAAKMGYETKLVFGKDGTQHVELVDTKTKKTIKATDLDAIYKTVKTELANNFASAYGILNPTYAVQKQTADAATKNADTEAGYKGLGGVVDSHLIRSDNNQKTAISLRGSGGGGSSGQPIALSKDGKSMLYADGTTKPVPDGFDATNFFRQAKQSPELTETEKISYTGLINSFKDNPPANENETRARYKQYRLDPDKFLGADPLLSNPNMPKPGQPLAPKADKKEPPTKAIDPRPVVPRTNSEAVNAKLKEQAKARAIADINKTTSKLEALPSGPRKENLRRELAEKNKQFAIDFK